MKLYNPFMPHYCQFGDGQFGMRKLSLANVGWIYLDTSDVLFWPGSNYTGSRHKDLAGFKAMVADRHAAIRREKNAKKTRRVS
jgi:hypothetical protein